MLITKIEERWEFRPSPEEVRRDIIGDSIMLVFMLFCLGVLFIRELPDGNWVNDTGYLWALLVLAAIPLLLAVATAYHIKSCWQVRNLPLIIEASGRISYGAKEICAAGTVRTVLGWDDDDGDDSITGYSVRLKLAEEKVVRLPYPYFSNQDEEEVHYLAKKFAGALGVEGVEKALLIYDVSKAPELSNPMDPNSATTGNTCFVLSEVYETEAGVADHFQQAMETWQDFPAFVKWLEKCKVAVVPAAPIFNSLW